MNVEYETSSLLHGLTDWGSADIQTAVEKAMEVNMNGNDLADLVREFATDTATQLADIDICYVIYDHILQMARNEIDNSTGFDISNDADFYTYGNAMCTSYDYSQESQEKLIEELSKLDDAELEQLLENEHVKVFLEDVEITKDDIIKAKNDEFTEMQ